MIDPIVQNAGAVFQNVSEAAEGDGPVVMPFSQTQARKFCSQPNFSIAVLKNERDFIVRQTGRIVWSSFICPYLFRLPVIRTYASRLGSNPHVPFIITFD